MSRHDIHINGISTSTSYTDGDCFDVLNLRLKNGALQPVAERKTVHTFTNKYSYVFEHRNAGYANTLAVRSGKLYFVVKNTGADTEKEITTVTGDATITQIGNVINLLDSNGVRYFVFNEQQYKELAIPELDIKLRRTIHLRDDEIEWFRFSQPTAADLETRINTAKALFAKSNSVLAAQGLLTEFHIGIAAVELFDGSYVSYSQPFLLGQSNDSKQRYENLAVPNFNGSELKDYYNNKALFWTRGYNENAVGDNKFEKLGEYVSYAGGMKFYAAGVAVSAAVYDTPVTHIPVTLTSRLGLAGVSSYLFRTGDDLQYRRSGSFNENLDQLVKNISIFISRPISMHKYESAGEVLESIPTFGGNSIIVTVENIYPETKHISDVRNELLKTDNFYKVHEIPYTEFISGSAAGWQTVNLKDKLGELLYSRETLPVSTMAESIIPKGQFTYNNKLHVYNYTSIFNKPLGVKAWEYEFGNGQIPDSPPYLPIANPKGYVTVKIKTDVGISIISNELDFTGVMIFRGFAPLISYPDRRAFEMKILIADSPSASQTSFTTRTVSLTPHPYHNIAVALSEDLTYSPISLSDPRLVLTRPLADMNRTLEHPNTIKVSSTNNPFYFPLAQTHAFSSKVTSLATNAQNIADRNYGTYPLYVITENGWFAMQVDSSGAGAYTQTQPIVASDTPVNNTAIVQTPYGVLFIGPKGLMSITSQGATLLTPHIEEDRRYINYENHEDFAGIIMLQDDSKSFSEFILNVTGMHYDPTEDEVIIKNSLYNYAYVFNVPAKMLYRTTEIPDMQIQNSYPTLKAIRAHKLIDYSALERLSSVAGNPLKLVEVAFTTRGIAFGTRDIKQLDRMILRALLHNMRGVAIGPESENPILAIYVSDDAVNYTIQRAMSIETDIYVDGKTVEPNFRDIDLGLMSRTKNRWFAVAFGAAVSPDSRIFSAEFIINKVYDNDKMR